MFNHLFSFYRLPATTSRFDNQETSEGLAVPSSKGSEQRTDRTHPPLNKRYTRDVISRLSGTSHEAGHRTPANEVVEPIGLPAIQSPVINNDGTIDKTNLGNFITALAALVPALPQGVDNTLSKRSDNLLGRLENIRHLAALEDPASNSQWLMEIRDEFAKAASDARKLAKHFLGLRYPRHLDTDTALAYSCLAAIFIELKRIHLTAAAPDVMSDYVKKELKNLEKSVPTIGYMSTSSISKDVSLGIGHDFGAASMEVTGSKNRTLWFDDDRDINFWNGYGIAVEAGGPAKWIVDTAFNLGIELGGVYFETEAMEDILKLIVNHDANHAYRFGVNSAGPKARSGMTRIKQGYNVLKNHLGAQAYTERHGSPHYLSDRKLAKGFNFTKLHILGTAFSRIMGTEKLGNLLVGAYPIPAQRLKAPENNGAFHEPLAKTVPLSDPLGRTYAPYRNYSASASVGKGKTKALSGNVKTGIDGSFQLSWNTAQFHLQNVEPSHRLLDPAYHGDMALTFELFSQLDGILNDARTDKPQELNLYREVRAKLGQQPTTPLSDIDLDFYGPEDKIPAQFRGSITSDSIDELSKRIKSINDVCIGLQADYKDFVENAAKVAAVPDKYTLQQIRDDLDAVRRNAFDAINRAVWGAVDGDPASGYPGGCEAALKNPEQFLAETHNAIGMALGCTGAHLLIVKRRMAQLLAASEDENLKNVRIMESQHADEMYLHTKLLLQDAYLPMKQEQVFLKGSAFEDTGLSQRHNVIAKLKAKGGFSFNIANAIADRFGHTVDKVELNNEVGQLALTVLCRYQFADYQINPSRQGHFLRFEFSVEAGNPVTGELLIKGMMALLKKRYPEADLRHQQQSLMEQLNLSTLVWSGTAGMGAVVRLRRFPGAANKHFDLQFVHVYEKRTSGPDIGVPILTPWGMFKAKWSKQTTVQNNLFESLGPDIGYLMLQHGKLESVLRDAATNAEKLADREFTQNAILAAQLKGGIDADPVLSEEFEGNKHVKWVADSYFTNPSLITTVIDRYMDYARAADEAETNGTTLANAPAENEFYRYYERLTPEEPFHRVAKTRNEVLHFAPGSTVNVIDRKNRIWGTPSDPFFVPESMLAKIRMPDLPSGNSWTQEKAYILQLPTVASRVDYFCSDRGWPMLDMFAKVIGDTKKVHNISRHRVHKTLYGFQTRLKDKGQRERAQLALRGAMTSSSEENTDNRIWMQLKRYGFRKPPSGANRSKIPNGLDITAFTSTEDNDESPVF